MTSGGISGIIIILSAYAFFMYKGIITYLKMMKLTIYIFTFICFFLPDILFYKGMGFNLYIYAIILLGIEIEQLITKSFIEYKIRNKKNISKRMKKLYKYL